MTQSLSTLVAGNDLTHPSKLRDDCAALAARIHASAPELMDAFHALELELVTLEAMHSRANRERQPGSSPSLLARAAELKGIQVRQRLLDLTVQAAAYRALPAPDPGRTHNQTPLAAPAEANAIHSLATFACQDDAYRLRTELARVLYGEARAGGCTYGL